MAKNTKSATMPPNLRHHPPSAEESETFFMKLKRKFKFKKGRYNVDISTGECDNVNPVSFKKRESSDLDQPFILGVGRSSERTSRSESPKPTKPTARAHSDRFVSRQLSTKAMQEGKISNIQNELRYNPQINANDFYKSGNGTISGNTTNAKSESKVKGNEYSVMKFEKDDTVLNRPMKFDSDHYVINECVVQDDSAVDLDNFGIEDQNPSRPECESSHGSNQDYERLPDGQEVKMSYSGSETTASRNVGQTSILTSDISESNYDFDPNYECVNDVKRKIRNYLVKENDKLAQALSESMESLEDPLYQSVKEVKQLQEACQDARKPSKTQDISRSIESLDEPGYESLNDVKTRISENIIKKRTLPAPAKQSEQDLPIGYEDKDTGNLNDSAISFSVMNDSMTGTQSHRDFEEDRTHTNTNHVLIALTGADHMGNSRPADDQQKAISSTGDQEAKNNVDVDQALVTESSLSTDTGFESNVEKIQENADITECLYSTVSKKKVNENTDKLNEKTVMVSEESILLHSETGKGQNDGVPGTDETLQALSKKDTGQNITVSMTDAEPIVPLNQINNFTEYDSDTELMLDPAYAECADAIKGFPPYHAFSDGSGSKISSCTSLDLSVEDFPPEPGYAECADAIKSGAIKKISISHEKLITEDVGGQPDVSIRKEQSSEIYANPQILFNKRSKMTERTPAEHSPSRTSSDKDLVGSIESLNSNTALTLTGEREPGYGKGEESSPEAPPLPARNYSLYLESDEAADLMSEDDKWSGSDDAFEPDYHLFKNAKLLTEGIQALSNKMDEKDIMRTYSESFEVSIDSKLIEGGSENTSVEHATNNNITKYESVDESDLKTDTNDDLLDLDDEKAKVNEKHVTNPMEEDECVQVTVIDKQGNTKILTVIDKQSSLKHGSKRQKGSSGSIRSASEKNTGAVADDSNTLDSGKGRVEYETEIGKKGFETEKDMEKHILDNQYHETYQEETVMADSFKSAAISHISFIPNDTSSSVDREYHSIRHLNSHISDIVTSSDTNLEMDKSSQLICTESMIEPSHQGSSPDTSFETKIKDELNEIQNQTIPGLKGGSLEVVQPVKMYSVSWDSDDEFQGTEHLPKLEIVESDIENVFDCSDSSGRLAYGNAEDENLIPRHSCVENESSSHATCSVKRVHKSAVNIEKSSHSFKGQTNCNTHIDKLNSGHITNSVKEHLKLSFTKPSFEDTDTVEEEYFDQIRDNAAFKTDLQSESVNFLSSCDRNEDSVTVCNNEKYQRDKEDEGEHVSPQNLHLLPSDFNSVLYDDREPTHMSLTEIMSFSVSSDTATLEPKQLSKSTANMSDLCAQSVELVEQDNPPPRPPSYNCCPSKDRNSSSSQSGQSNSNSPMDDSLPGFGFAERSLSDVEETPPAIPPRVQVRKVHHARRDSDARDFMESMRQLKDCGWYWGPLSWEEAEQKLANKPEGTFLVRDSSDERYILSLSFKNQGRVHHTRIEHHRGHFSFWSQPDSHGKSTIKEFIEQCVNNSENGRFLYFIRPSGPGSPPMPIHLLYPVSRFIQMQSLQHMCRFRILQMVRRDHIDSLPVPKRIKQYLKEAQYYVEYLDD